MATNSEGNGAAPAVAERPARRLLLIATEDLRGPSLAAEVRGHLGGGAAEIRVVAPAVESNPLRHALGDVDDASQQARVRLDEALEALEALGGGGVAVSGHVGDTDPILAAEDELRLFPADEVLLVGHADDQARWFENDLFDRAREKLEPEVTLITIRHEDGAPGTRVVDVEHVDEGLEQESAGGADVSPYPELPGVTRGDLAGITIAIVGTIAAIVLASVGPGPGSPGGAVQILIAMGIALINMAHVVGLVLFESVRYRGGWQKFFRNLSLIGTPTAVVVNLLIALLA